MALVLISTTTLAYLKIDFDLDVAWTFAAMDHRKAAGDDVGAFLKSTARHVTLSKSVHLSSPRDFYDFLVKDQFATAKATGRADPTMCILFLKATEIEKIKNLAINPRTEKFRSTGKGFVIFLFTFLH